MLLAEKLQEQEEDTGNWDGTCTGDPAAAQVQHDDDEMKKR